MKGIFSQGVAVLFREPVTLADLRPLLPTHPFLKETPAGPDWAMGGATAVIAFQPEKRGHGVIDTVPHPWPDHMGDPKSDPMIFGAWSMGHFGPFAFPNGLRRAMEHSSDWREAKTRVPEHRAFVRCRVSWVLGGGPDATVLPADYDPRAELEFLVQLARAILNHPAAIAYFNPSGEVLLDANRIDDSLRFHAAHNLPALDLWSNLRLFAVNPEWSVMDSVGNAQLDVRDHEVAFMPGKFSTADVGNFIRNASNYLREKGDVIATGETMNGPGGLHWVATRYSDTLCSPPRRVLCWLPKGATDVPERICRREAERSGDATGRERTAVAQGSDGKLAERSFRSRGARRPWWRFW